MGVRFDRDCAFVFVHECLRGWRKCRRSLNGALGTPDARKKCRRATSVPRRRQKQRYGTRRPDTARTADQDFRAKALIHRTTEGRLQAGGRGFEPRSAHRNVLFGAAPRSRLSSDDIVVMDFSSAEVESFWMMHDGDAVGLVRIIDLRDIGEGTPLFDLRIASAHRGRGFGEAGDSLDGRSPLHQFSGAAPHRSEHPSRQSCDAADPD